MAVSQSFLSNLSIEILRFITAPLTRKDLKALRLTNRKLHSIASENLFHSIAVTTNDASYLQLLNIAASDYWSAQVRHVDWVLLHEAGKHPALAQELEFNELWTSRLKKQKVVPTKGQAYYGLELQCQLLKKIPNVQSVRFWSANQSQRLNGGGEPWEETHAPEARDQIKSNTMLYATNQNVPRSKDVFSILQHSKLTPRVVKTIVATLHLEFSSSKELKSVEILGHSDYWGEGDQYRGVLNIAERKFFSHDMNCFSSLINSKISKLRSFEISGVWIFLEHMAVMLGNARKLRKLHIGNIELSDYDEQENPMMVFLRFLRDQYNQGSLHDLKVAFHETICREFIGRFSATEEQVQAWMEGSDDKLLNAASSAFKETPDDDDEFGAAFFRRIGIFR